MKSWSSRLLELALAVLAAALMLHWAWRLLRPLAPVIVVLAGMALTLSFMLRRSRGW